MPLFYLGFRVFFLLASVFGLFAIMLWIDVLLGHIPLTTGFASTMHWHAHEMIFGFAMAVIAGFLLTAVKNWTGEKTLEGVPLAVLAGVWLLARIVALTKIVSVQWLFLLEMVFFILLIAALTRPIVKVGNNKSLVIVSKLVFLMLSDAAFFLGVMGVWELGQRIGLISAIYVIVALMLTLGRRVIPFFIERGVPEDAQLRQSALLDRASLLLLVALWILEMALPNAVSGAWIALLLALIHAVRLQAWYTRGIWSHPLLWSLLLAYGFLILGFALRAAQFFWPISYSLIIHAFTVGGVGLMTVSMMARVSLGHTGRPIYDRSTLLWLICTALGLAGFTRVILPLAMSEHTLLWLRLTQGLWVIAFLLLLWKYVPIWSRARIDGKPG